MYIDNLKIDKINGTCAYNDEMHKYIDTEDKSTYISVTTLIDKYKPPYDADFWSSYKAMQLLLNPEDFQSVKSVLLQTKKFDVKILDLFKITLDTFNLKKTEILADWEERKITSCERGTAIHLEKELKFYKSPEHVVEYLGIQGSFKCEKDYYELDLEKGIYPEFLISKKTKDGKLKIAGQIDLLIKDGNDLILVDYKTNRELKSKSYFDQKTKKHQMMKYPINNIMDCSMGHYTLQLSLYAYLLQLVNPNFNIKKLMIIHYDHDNKETHYVLEYKKKEIELLLSHYKKQSALDKVKESNKPIIY